MKHPSQSQDVGELACARKRRTVRPNPAQRVALERGDAAAFFAAGGLREATADERRTLDAVARRDHWAVRYRAARKCNATTARVVAPINLNSERARRESHARPASPTRGSPDDDGEGEHSPGEVGEPTGAVLRTLASPLRGLHAGMIRRSALADGIGIPEYAARVAPYLVGDRASQRMFGEAVEVAQLDQLLSLERAA